MMPRMEEMVTWLRGVLSERRALAEKAAKWSKSWTASDPEEVPKDRWFVSEEDSGDLVCEVSFGGAPIDEAFARHIAENDPRAVWNRTVAELRIIEAYATEPTLEIAVRVMAFANRRCPGWQPDWQPAPDGWPHRP